MWCAPGDPCFIDHAGWAIALQIVAGVALGFALGIPFMRSWSADKYRDRFGEEPPNPYTPKRRTA